MPKCIIEFVGPSGVGKTSLLLGAKKKLTTDWQFQPSEFLLTFDQNLLPDTIHFQMLLLKASELAANNKMNSLQKTNLLNYFSLIVLRDLEIRFSNRSVNYILDEGIFHNFSSAVNNLDENNIKILASERSVVYLRPDNPETVVGRIFKRKNEAGILGPHHQGLTHYDLTKLICSSVERFDKLVKKLESVGVKILVLRAESNLNLNIESLLEFEKELLDH
jgi:hypothetical protein